ncbi:MAG: TIGR04282 family arsenosugar biosynthesis glycosyltransferase [Planctomycetia bacterium]|nr:TIGR04282 family arsenosugar biosynthesis glycosyltransferase [Planctomycetia bacterium]
MKRRLCMFAKHWAPGQVKSRLAATVGDERASRLYRAFLESLLERLPSADWECVLAFAPVSARSEFENLVRGTVWRLEPQADGDLGARMAAALSAGFSAGCDAVVLVGSDSPTLPVNFVHDAFAKLERSPVVLGRAADGGYYLLGARPPVPPIFTGMAWSTPDVFEQTVSRLAAAGIGYERLPDGYDVDDANGLLRLREELSRAAEHADEGQSLSRLRRAVAEILGPA